MLLTGSTYERNNFCEDFEKIISEISPKLIVEFGIGNGYSLECLLKFKCKVVAFDLFDDYEYSRPDEGFIRNKFANQGVEIVKGDFYDLADSFENNSIDLLHIDISNDADVYEFALNNYYEKLSDTGVMLLEGGSAERDSVVWMRRFNKKSINPYLMKIKDSYNIEIIDKFPSLTIVRK